MVPYSKRSHRDPNISVYVGKKFVRKSVMPSRNEAYSPVIQHAAHSTSAIVSRPCPIITFGSSSSNTMLCTANLRTGCARARAELCRETETLALARTAMGCATHLDAHRNVDELLRDERAVLRAANVRERDEDGQVPARARQPEKGKLLAKSAGARSYTHRARARARTTRNRKGSCTCRGCT